MYECPASQRAHTFLHAFFSRAFVRLNYSRYPVVVCDLFRQSTKSDGYHSRQKYPSQSQYLYHPFYFLSLIPSCISSPYRSPPAHQSLSSSSLHLFPHFPIPHPPLSTSTSPYHYFVSLSLSPLHRLRLLDWQCRHAEVNWDVAAMTGPLYWFVHLHHPSWCPRRAQTHTYKHTCTHTNTQRSQQEEACPGPRPSKLITLPWWSGPVNLARPQCWRENERIASVSVTTWASVETINKMNRHKAGSAAQWAMEMCIASSAFLSLFIGGNWLLLWLWLPALFFIFFVHVLLL